MTGVLRSLVWLARRFQMQFLNSKWGLVLKNLISKGLLFGLLVAWLASGWMSAVAVAISGLGCSGIFPSLLALTGTLFFNVAGTSLGLLASMNWIGGMFIVWMAGVLSQRVNVQWGFVAIVLASLAGVFVHSLKYRTFLRAETVASIANESVDN